MARRIKVIYIGTDENSNNILKSMETYYMSVDEYNETWLFYNTNDPNEHYIGICHSKRYINKWVINIATWREQQINSILND
jgi:hypothetical protein